jgi:predicted GNAT family acetyltransferase
MKITSDGKGFYADVNGGRAELLYKIEGNVISMFHTYVPDEARGQGIAEQLALAAFDFAKRRGLRVRPDCSYIQHFVEKHAEFSGMVAYQHGPPSR